MPWEAQSIYDEILKYLELRERGNQEQTAEGAYITVGPGRLGARLSDALAADMAIAGIERYSILTEARIGLTGGYGLTSRPWDLVVINDDLPVVVVEIKVSLDSYLNSIRNRIDEIVALAASVARTFDGPDRAPYKPCTAVLFVMEESLATTRLRDTPPTRLSFPGDAQPGPSSYIDLVGATFSRMLADGLLDAVCYLTVDVKQAKISEPFSDQSFDAFASKMLTHIATAARGRASGAMSAASLGRVLSRGDDIKEVVSGLTSTPEGLSAAEAAVVRERRRVVADLQQLALDPDTNETKMHEAIGARYWIFGGQYTGIADRRTIVPLDQYDIPLICADGSLEIVELKGPEVKLTRKYRNHLIVANEVHAAVNQCLNYLRALDEMGAALRTQYRNELAADFDFRRAKGTVIIGHPGHTPSTEATREQIDQTVRSYNAHLSRLTVLTYADLLESAERALQFASEESSKPLGHR
ncbi:Shedu anti-phage system protein SduA domain-containing protein [Pseudonocardia xinjiangensis]|uniref:DUF4263 domain-containing protein n=1 Tax=Pseudonocardia xinjiangensis TaxID=75289 RepID=A0ABX1RBQ1_9PSEU|nr:Shedu anti-phage system protein SduA domain-containing protein [Pseudonocardia xinjiangensis]NMH77226.1 DUF4263 domain-containing protein [Pseudonocardia xinjiangensis]